MGLFDSIHCKMPLPDDAPEHVKACPVFQTYDLGRGMNDYVIDEDGRLFLESGLMSELITTLTGKTTPFLPIEYDRKRIEMSACNGRGGRPTKNGYEVFTEDGSDRVEIGYVVQIRNGVVSSITEKYRSSKPARPMAEWK